jgi:hypothetical protein
MKYFSSDIQREITADYKPNGKFYSIRELEHHAPTMRVNAHGLPDIHGSITSQLVVGGNRSEQHNLINGQATTGACAPCAPSGTSAGCA